MKQVFILLFYILSNRLWANEIYQLENQNLTEKQVSKINEFFNEVSYLLPEKIKEKIDEKVNVSFEEIEGSDKLSQLPKDKCNTNFKLIYGKTKKIKSKKIIINSILLNEIVSGNINDQTFNCGHKNYYRTAMATLLHETAHFYDHLHFGKTLISGKKSFYKLSDFKKGLIFGLKAKNKSFKRSIDPYEYQNIEEHFAVNFEYFILDPQYKCKRPSYYKFFSEEFEFSPYQNQDCQINTIVQLDDTKAKIDFDPKKIYRIDYLLASKGDELISGFGHSMYRIILCAPFRESVSKDCLKDKLYHVVISFRANVTDIKSNPIKGILGKYDSVLYLLSFSKVIEEYNESELRDLYSVPLILNDDQKERFIHKTLEMYWEYAGKYKFLTQNCASESNELFQAALNNDSIIKDDVVKPYSLMKLFIKHHFIERDPFKDIEQSKKLGYVFESDSALLEKIKSRLFGDNESDFIVNNETNNYEDNPLDDNKVVKKKKHIKDILEEMAASDFEDVLNKIMAQDPNEETRKDFNDLSIITQATMKVLQHDLDEEIGDYLEKLQNEKSELGDVVRAWNEKRKNNRYAVLEKDYGIPLKISDETAKANLEATMALEKTENDLVEKVKDNYQGKIDRLLKLKAVVETARNKSKIIALKKYLNQ